MDFIDEKYRPSGGKHTGGICPTTINYFAHVFYPGCHGRQCIEWRFGRVGENAGKRCLADSGRAPQYEAAHVAAFNHTAQRGSRPYKVCLADIIIERCRAKSFS